MTKKAMAPATRAKKTTPPTTPPAIAPALLLCEPLLLEADDGAPEDCPVAVDDAELEIVPVGFEDDAVASGVSMTNC